MKRKIQQYVKDWERKGYSHGIPQEAPPRLEANNRVPSYRQICRAIMRNDLALTTLGFSRPKTDAYMAIKRVEIEARNRGKMQP